MMSGEGGGGGYRRRIGRWGGSRALCGSRAVTMRVEERGPPNVQTTGHPVKTPPHLSSAISPVLTFAADKILLSTRTMRIP